MLTTATISLKEATHTLAKLVKRVATGKQRVILKSPGQPDVALITASDLQQLEYAALPYAQFASPAAWLAEADALRARIAARLGSFLPDSSTLLNELREERDNAILNLR